MKKKKASNRNEHSKLHSLATTMLTSICLIVIKVIYAQNIATHVREWPSILLHVVLMSINICLRALYIMDNNVGALQDILLGGATQNSVRKNIAKQPSPAGPSSYRVQQMLSSSAMQMRWKASPLPSWKQEMPWRVKPFKMGKWGLDLFTKEAQWTGDLFLDRGTVPRKDNHADRLPDFGQVT